MLRILGKRLENKANQPTAVVKTENGDSEPGEIGRGVAGIGNMDIKKI